MLRDYEIGFILKPDLKDEDVKKVIDMVESIISKNNGEVENVDEWGKRKLTYPIQKLEEGIYVFITAQSEGTAIFEIERKFRQNEDVIRFISLRFDERNKKSNRLTKKWEREDKVKKMKEMNQEKAVEEDMLKEVKDAE